MPLLPTSENGRIPRKQVTAEASSIGMPYQEGSSIIMKLVKCPRCELNYIQEGEKYCKVCYRELKGEQHQEEM